MTLTHLIIHSASDQLKARVDYRKHLYEPNAFSSKGDGIKDYFTFYKGNWQVKIIQLL